MIWVKTILFFLTVITIRLIFVYINDIGDRRIALMKELIDFTDYLRIYSCDMKMSFEEALNRYGFRSEAIKSTCIKLLDEIRTKFKEDISHSRLDLYMEKALMTPADFNDAFSEISSYYGSTYSDVLEKKLILTIKEMEKITACMDEKNRDKKNLYNKISVLVGCLTAIILI